MKTICKNFVVCFVGFGLDDDSTFTHGNLGQTHGNSGNTLQLLVFLEGEWLDEHVFGRIGQRKE